MARRIDPAASLADLRALRRSRRAAVARRSLARAAARYDAAAWLADALAAEAQAAARLVRRP